VTEAEHKGGRRKLVLLLFATSLAGAASARLVPYDWFLSVLGYSLLVALILSILVAHDAKNERHAPAPFALLLEVLFLPSRNADITLGLGLWAFFHAAGFVTGFLLCAMFLPLFT
jgi:hypothetical protein